MFSLFSCSFFWNALFLLNILPENTKLLSGAESSPPCWLTFSVVFLSCVLFSELWSPSNFFCSRDMESCCLVLTTQLNICLVCACASNVELINGHVYLKFVKHYLRFVKKLMTPSFICFYYIITIFMTCATLGTVHYFLKGMGSPFSWEKLFANGSWLKEIVCFKVMKGKNCLQSKGKFFQIHWYFKISTQIGLDMKVPFSFI